MAKKTKQGDEIRFTLIHAGHKINELMRAFDLNNDPSKVFGGRSKITATCDGTKTIRQIFQKLLKSLKSEFQVVYFAYDGTYCDGRWITDIDLKWQDTNIKTISDGKRIYPVDALK